MLADLEENGLLRLSTHLSLGKRLQLLAIAYKAAGGGYFQPTHLWESDCNSRSQNLFLESFLNTVLAKLLKLRLIDSSERLL